MPETYSRWDAANYIDTPEDAGLFLEAAIDDDPGDGSIIRAALSAIARAQNMSALARVAGLDRSGLYKALSEEGNPSLATILKVIRALGLKLRIVPADQIAP